jgi:hypothetical protein
MTLKMTRSQPAGCNLDGRAPLQRERAGRRPGSNYLASATLGSAAFAGAFFS